MKTDFNSIRKELEKLTDVDYLKKELARVKEEIKNFDVNVHLTPQAKAKLRGLEQSFDELRKRVSKFQKQVDSEIVKFASIIRKAGFGGKNGDDKSSGNKTSGKKASAAKTSGQKTSAKAAAPKATSSKKAATNPVKKTSRKKSS